MSVMRCPRRATPAQRPSPRSGGAHICGEAKSVGRCADATRLAEPRCTSRRRVRARPAGLSSPPSRGGPPSRDAALRARRLRQISRAKIATPPVGPDRRWRPSGLTTTAPAPTPECASCGSAGERRVRQPSGAAADRRLQSHGPAPRARNPTRRDLPDQRPGDATHRGLGPTPTALWRVSSTQVGPDGARERGWSPDRRHARGGAAPALGAQRL